MTVAILRANALALPLADSSVDQPDLFEESA